MTKIQSEIFELGRGAELRNTEGYWHQYVVKYNFEETQRPFIISEIGKTEELSKLQLSLSEIQQPKWSKVLKITECEDLIKDYHSNKESVINNLMSKKKTAQNFEGKWTTDIEIEVLDYNSNHGNWVDSRDIPGYFKFELDLKSIELKNCRVLIPVEYLSGGPGHYSIYYGRFELTNNEILIWQNEVFPFRVKYDWKEDRLELNLFKKKIEFIKE